MKKLTLLLVAIIFIGMSSAYAEHHPGGSDMTEEEAVLNGDVHVSVNGLVCDFCAQSLKKVFSKEQAVEMIDVNLDTKIIMIKFKESQTLDDETITNLITDSGYDVEDIHRVE